MSEAGGATLEASATTAELRLSLEGRLDVNSVAPLWRQAHQALQESRAPRTVVDVARVRYCDGAGIGLLLDLQRRHQQAAREFTIEGLAAEFQRQYDLYEPDELCVSCEQPQRAPDSAVEALGRAGAAVGRDFRHQLAFLGELATAMAHALRHPRQVRWRDAALVAETAGVDALPIIALISFLMGLILAFQAAIPMKQFGADIFVADLVSLSLLRELGPLMTAIVLTGRSGSAFAAEIGTMKVNEEVNALVTMGLDPVRFLVVPRTLAAVVTTPLLAVFANLCGLIGGAVVFLMFGYPLVTYVSQVASAVDSVDLLGGLFKAFVFGILIAATGCLRGLQTRSGSRAVGDSATRSVVSGLILIIVADGLFSILFYYLGL